MKKSLLIVSLLLFGLSSSPSYSYKVYNQAGGTSCGTWLKEARTGDSLSYHQLTSWVFGFVSGVGAAGINLTETDHNSLRAFVTQHCQRHPKDHVADAAQQLVGTLEKIKVKGDCQLPFQIQ
jgi:hypothetical protein